MPNGHDYTRGYGGHDYGENPQGTVDCKLGCGCWAGPARSGGPLGVNPLGGECPNNPESGSRLPGNTDYEIVVTRRIRGLEKAAYEFRERAEKAEKRVGVKKAELADKLEVAEEKTRRIEEQLLSITELMKKTLSEISERFA